MARPHLDFIEEGDQPQELIAAGPWFGARRRWLSRDGESDASTAVLECYPGWSANLGKESGLLELLVIEGEIIANGRRLGRGGYIRSEQASLLHGLQAVAASRLLVMPDPSFEPAGGAREVVITDTEQLQYVATKSGKAGMGLKALWDDPDRGPVSWIISNCQRFLTGPEFHECPEEIYVLAGDVTGRYGTMTAGSYFWRPEFINHGPYWSETGLTVFLRGFGQLYAYWHDDADATPEQNRANLPRFQAERAAQG